MVDFVILTGAGVSAESGLGTFRDEGGLWAQHRIEDVATPEGFARNPKLVMDFYNARRAQAADAKANAAHHALARLAAHKEVVLVTQNVDGLHEQAARDGDTSYILHMHGALDRANCTSCGARWDAPMVMHPQHPCPECGAPTGRPDIVWFGEIPYHMDRIDAALQRAATFVSIGTSGNVYPAAGFVQAARMYGAHTVELNMEATQGATFAGRHVGPASEVVPDWVEAVLG
ncbi:MAG: NAD-dependent deacylase [Pseudomonadota bacterium]